jgi:hypothetical protein
VNKFGTSAAFVFSTRLKETLLDGPYTFVSGHIHAVEAFTEIAQDGPLPLRASRTPHPYRVAGFV